MYKKTLIIPTRDRPKMFHDCLATINQFTANKQDLEILVIADDGDTATQEYVKAGMSAFPGIGIKMLTRPWSDHSNRDYYNWAADQSTGDLIWVFADDLMICVNNWDLMLDTVVSNYQKAHPDNVFCVSVRDNTPPPSHRLPKFPCFPMFTRPAMAALGWILHPKPKNWGVDYINYKIFGPPLNRICELHDRNYINHVSYHTHQVPSDATAIRIGQIFNQSKMIPHHNTDRILAEEVIPIQEQVKAYIEKVQHEQSTTVTR